MKDNLFLTYNLRFSHACRWSYISFKEKRISNFCCWGPGKEQSLRLQLEKSYFDFFIASFILLDGNNKAAIKRKSNFDVDFVSSNEKNSTLHPFPIIYFKLKKVGI